MIRSRDSDPLLCMGGSDRREARRFGRGLRVRRRSKRRRPASRGHQEQDAVNAGQSSTASGPTHWTSSHAAWSANSTPHPFSGRATRQCPHLRRGQENLPPRDRHSPGAALATIANPRFATIAFTHADGLRVIRAPIRDAGVNALDTGARAVLVAGHAEERILPLWARSIASPRIPAG